MKNKLQVIKNYLNDETAAMSVVEIILIILAVIVIAGLVINWVYTMVNGNMSTGTNQNNSVVGNITGLGN